MPKTTENFRVLSVEKKYVKSEFDKVIPGLMIKGGSIEKKGIFLYKEQFLYITNILLMNLLNFLMINQDCYQWQIMVLTLMEVPFLLL